MENYLMIKGVQKPLLVFETPSFIFSTVY